MDLYRVIDALHEERNRLDQIIRSLELVAPGRTPRPKVSRAGRKFMDAAGRREVAERMKRYWARRREAEGREKAGETLSVPVGSTPEA